MDIAEGKKAVRIKDANNTIIFVDKNVSAEEAIRKYHRDLKESELNSTKSSAKIGK